MACFENAIGCGPPVEPLAFVPVAPLVQSKEDSHMMKITLAAVAAAAAMLMLTTEVDPGAGTRDRRS